MATDRITAGRGRARWLLPLLAVVSLSLWTGASAQSPPTRVVDAASIIEQFSSSLADGRREVKSHLARLGFGQELDALRSLEGNQLYGFSSETVVETLYRRAAATSPEEGKRFLAVLYADASQRSAAVAIDPVFAEIRAFTPEALKAPIQFASASRVLNIAQRTPLSPAAERAIGILAETYSGKSLARLRSTMVRHLRKPTFDPQTFDRSLADASSTKDALRRIIEAGTPPPSATEALRDVLRDTVRTSAALSLDRNTLTVMDDLSRELPPELERYRRVEDSLVSRRRQATQALLVAEPSKSRAAASNDVIDNMRRPPESDSLMPPSQPGPGGGGGGGGGRGTPRASGSPSARAYADYTNRTFESRTAKPASTARSVRPSGVPFTGSVAPTPRRYSRAIVSVRAARGIAMGGKVISSVSAPVQAFWVANRSDDRFGRLFVVFAPKPGAPTVVAASRVLFADSFYAARSLLWDQHDDQATFVDGEILVLMSMDPGGAVTREAAAALQQRWTALRAQALTVTTDTEKAAFNERLKTLLQERQNLPRAIVVHPSIAGRELAWSAARVDFWFNELPLLSTEAAAVNGGRGMSQSLLALPISQAQTWQFYEKDSTVRLAAAGGPALQLSVSSKTDRDATSSNRSHFRVSLFRLKGDTDASAETIPELEQQVQPLLDWLATNHHDFMRLNDLSEAFSLLRWLAPSRAGLTILDLDGDSRRIATPDRVVIGKGPGVQPPAAAPRSGRY